MFTAASLQNRKVLNTSPLRHLGDQMYFWKSICLQNHKDTLFRLHIYSTLLQRIHAINLAYTIGSVVASMESVRISSNQNTWDNQTCYVFSPKCNSRPATACSLPNTDTIILRIKPVSLSHFTPNVDFRLNCNIYGVVTG